MMTKDLTQHCALFRGLTPERAQELLETYGYALRSYPPRSFAAMQGDTCRTLLIVCHGQVNAWMAGAGGKQIIVEQFADWDVLAPAFLMATHNVFPVSIETTTESELLVIHRDTLLKMLHADMRMMENYLREISDKCFALTQRISSFALKSLREQLLTYLHTHDTYARQQDIADRFGVARPSLNRVLQELSQEGIVKMVHGKIKLLRRFDP